MAAANSGKAQEGAPDAGSGNQKPEQLLANHPDSYNGNGITNVNPRGIRIVTIKEIVYDEGGNIHEVKGQGENICGVARTRAYPIR